jgi:hypothetical protein
MPRLKCLAILCRTLRFVSSLCFLEVAIDKYYNPRRCRRTHAVKRGGTYKFVKFIGNQLDRVLTRRLLQGIVALSLVATLGCAGWRAAPPATARTTHLDYVVFGLSVFCASTDSPCLEQQFNRCLGQTRKRHIRENGRPQKLTRFTEGGALAEWWLRGSGDRVTITYDNQGVAREWTYEGSWGLLHGGSFTARLADD